MTVRARLASLSGTTPIAPAAGDFGFLLLRVSLGLMWLYNVAWKKAPTFGRDSDSGLFRYTSDAVSHPVFPPYSWVVEHVVLPHFQAFGWAVLIVESLLAVLLLTGFLTRLAAGIGVAQSLAIALAVANAPNEWPWSYWLMIAAHLALLLGAGSRRWSLDSVRTAASGPSSRGSFLVVSWGVIGLVTAAWAVLSAMSSESPALVGSKDLALAVGVYGTAATVAVAATGALLLLSEMAPWRVLRPVAALVALAAAAGVYSQLIEGTNSSAAFLLCFALVGVVRLRRQGLEPILRQTT